MQFGFMPGKETVDAIFIVRRAQKKYKKDKKLYMCFVDMEKAFNSCKKSNGVAHEKEGSIRSNGLGSYELV